ncbi:nitrile hydratase subunit alpha [Elioraea sp.]|uniref:nitrile hydratase subunit alpha n=1 Tax=Elioraea sp. TaxID=2185103 RepID=UPI0025BCFE04|nr:nitrile hydratase subunit alpha [Elioraea sp.]
MPDLPPPHAHPQSGPHDIGGLGGPPVDRDEHDYAHWEKEADAIRMLLADAKRNFFTTDETRSLQERLDGDTYWALPYYERWIHAFSGLLVQKGVIGEDELSAEVARLRAAGADVIPYDDHHDHDHDHDHDHGRAHQPDHDAGETVLSPLRLRALAVRERLVARGIVTREEITAEIARMDARGEHLGARVVARAWSDPAYAARLAADGNAAGAELGIPAAATRLTALFNTATLHNLVVCTLCSCYPRTVLGRPPAWYKSRAYRARAVSEPRAVLAEFGLALPDDVEIRVHDSTAENRYLVIPARPPGTESWSEERLARLVTRDSMIGVAHAREAA